MQVVIKYFVILDHTCNKLTFVVILHRGLRVQTIRSRDLHYTQVPCHFLSAGTLQMVSEHYVACRFEHLGLDKPFDHSIISLSILDPSGIVR